MLNKNSINQSMSWSRISKNSKHNCLNSLKNIKNISIFYMRCIRIFAKRCYKIISTFFFAENWKNWFKISSTSKFFLMREKFAILIRTESKKNFSIDNQMSITSMKITICRMRSIETNRKIKKNDVNIVKDEVKKTKLCTKRLKNLKIKISSIFFQWRVINVTKTNIMFEIASNSNSLKSRRKKNIIDQCCFDCFNLDF